MSVIRLAALLTVGALSLPVELSAQRIPLPGTGRPRPARPATLPPQAEPIARNLFYKRMRLSVESYPLISYVRSPLSTGGPVSDWSTFGAGTRADYRLTRNASVTLDVTSSFAGGLTNFNTLELGTRLGRERSERTLYSFIDLRVGYVESYRSLGAAGEFAFPSSESGPVFGYSNGLGALAGVGAEYALTRRFSLTAGAAMMRNRMTTGDYFSGQASSHSFTMTVYRVMLGLRFNPVRLIRPPG